MVLCVIAGMAQFETVPPEKKLDRIFRECYRSKGLRRNVQSCASRCNAPLRRGNNTCIRLHSGAQRTRLPACRPAMWSSKAPHVGPMTPHGGRDLQATFQREMLFRRHRTRGNIVAPLFRVQNLRPVAYLREKARIQNFLETVQHPVKSQRIICNLYCKD